MELRPHLSTSEVEALHDSGVPVVSLDDPCEGCEAPCDDEDSVFNGLDVRSTSFTAEPIARALMCVFAD